MIQIIKSSLLGGLIVFLWGMISWMVLPLHRANIQSFSIEPAVQQILDANAPQSGVYVLPSEHKKMTQGPFAFVVYSKEGKAPMPLAMVRSFLIETAAAALIVFLILQTNIRPYWRRVSFVVYVALAGGIMCHLCNWNWMAFPTSYVALQFLDLMVGWFLAGLLIAKLSNK